MTKKQKKQRKWKNKRFCEEVFSQKMAIVKQMKDHEWQKGKNGNQKKQ